MSTTSSAVAFALGQHADTATTCAAYERGALACLRGLFEFEVGFFVRSDGVGEGSFGLDLDRVRSTRPHFASYGRELASVVRQARLSGVAVDQEVFDNPLKQRARQLDNLVAYTERMRQVCWA